MTITRAEILRRAHAVPLRSDEYSQARLDGDGANASYRPDCSGWVSYCWGCPTSGPGTWGGYSTSTFVTTDWAPGVKGIMYEIPRGELLRRHAAGDHVCRGHMSRNHARRRAKRRKRGN